MSRPDPDTWVEVTADALPVAEVLSWSSSPDCGAVAAFCGTVRDHSEGRPGVISLEYEAYEPYATRIMGEVAGDVHRRFPHVRRLALLHRIGVLGVGEVSVVVALGARHRPEAFDAVRFSIDTIKSTVPIWKRETWAGGSDWVTCPQPAAAMPDTPAR